MDIKDLTIEQLKEEIKRREEENKAPYKSLNVYCVVCDNFTSYDAKDIIEVKKVLQHFEAKDDMSIIKSSGHEYKTDKKTKYRVNCNQDYHGMNLRISIGIDGFGINVSIKYHNLPKEIKDMFIVGDRNVSDTEHHYFTGVDINKIKKIKLPTFCPPYNIECINWYKGDKTILNTDFINKLISNIIE